MSDPEMTTFGMHPEPEPVAWFCKLPDNKISIKIVGKPTEGNWEPLYTAPPQHESTCAQCEKKASDGWALYCVDCLREFYKHDPTTKREWVGLTKEEAREICVKNVPYVVDMVAALEATLKERNT